MTMRELVNKKVRARTLCLLLSLAVFVLSPFAGVFLAAECAVPDGIALGVSITAGFAVFLVIGHLAYQKWRCPTCKEPLLRYAQVGGFRADIFTMPMEFRFCPYCGQGFDEEIEP